MQDDVHIKDQRYQPRCLSQRLGWIDSLVSYPVFQSVSLECSFANVLVNSRRSCTANLFRLLTGFPQLKWKEALWTELAVENKGKMVLGVTYLQGSGGMTRRKRGWQRRRCEATRRARRGSRRDGCERLQLGASSPTIRRMPAYVMDSTAFWRQVTMEVAVA